MSVEDIKVGYFQILLLCLLAVNYIIVSMSHALPAFHNYTPKFYCESSDGMNKSYGCIMANSTMEIHHQEQKALTFCTSEYIFVTDYGERTIVTDWGLICERSYLKNFSIIVYYIGVSIGGCIAGILADQFGRLPVLAICLYSQGTMAVATYIVQSYPVFLGLRGLQGLFAQGLQSTTYILTLELFPVKFRTLVASIMGIAWAAGLVILAGLSYIIPDWRILQLAVSVPTALTVLYIWIIPDSPRWLVAKGKTTEADIALENIIKYNSCCCCCKTRRELVVDNSENVTPIKPERKSRVFSSDEKTNSEGEAANLLTPSTSVSRNSPRLSLRVISENLEKRLSNPEVFIQVSELISETTESLNVESKRNSKVSQTKVHEENNITGVPVVTIEKKEITDIVECKCNPVETIDDMVEEKIHNSCCTLENTCMIKYGGTIFCQWLSVSMINFLVIHFQPNAVDNRHINFAIGGTIELTIYVVIYFILSRHGRRLPMGVCQTLNGVICIMIAGLVFLPRVTAFSSGLTKSLLLVLGRVTALGTLGVLHLYTVEIFPTVIRGTSVGLCMVIGTIGNISGPYILLLSNYTSPATPFILAGVLCLLSAILCFILPETNLHILPDSWTNVECFRKQVVQLNDDDTVSEREILREKLFSEDWVDAGNGIIVNFTENKN